VLFRSYIKKSDLDEIIKIYNKLKDNNRLFITSTTAKEFTKNRPKVILKAHEKIIKYKNELSINLKIPKFSFLDNYTKIDTTIEKINEILKEYKKQIDTLLNEIENYNWNDNISKIYSTLFKAENIIDDLNNDFSSEWSNRKKLNIPPGYKDGDKSTGGMGDFIIWKQILEFAKEKNSNIIFVSNDMKEDWYHVYNFNNNTYSLYPRYELLYEFKRYTKKDISIINFEKFLEIHNSKFEKNKIIDNENDIKVDNIQHSNLKYIIDYLDKAAKINKNQKLYELNNEGKLIYTGIPCPRCHADNPVKNDWCYNCGYFLG